jgi:hypothetical protein
MIAAIYARAVVAVVCLLTLPRHVGLGRVRVGVVVAHLSRPEQR